MIFIKLFCHLTSNFSFPFADNLKRKPEVRDNHTTSLNGVAGIFLYLDLFYRINPNISLHFIVLWAVIKGSLTHLLGVWLKWLVYWTSLFTIVNLSKHFSNRRQNLYPSFVTQRRSTELLSLGRELHCRRWRGRLGLSSLKPTAMF